ncbi:hypothetical protein [Nitratiruptor sp. YY09-18]|uniref:hypothetical protein n=1 Tax=Nitratiruptor sp. YY09-18 TaxID=2724901 RepID=UPI001915B62B|nr:hypothetical protein [Nitratiruptor sp. YY09-18]BCD68809.1 hypothetical protein NitYY0918_C1728 [Nitratiruptor sp. YY09-18]
MYKAIMAVLVLVLLSGCFKKEPPKCSDEETIETVKEIFAKNVDEIYDGIPLIAIMKMGKKGKIDFHLPKKIVDIKDALPVSYDEKIKRRECQATAVLDTNDTAQISYTVQLSEKDPDQFYVELKFDFLQPILQKHMMQSFMGGAL